MRDCGMMAPLSTRWVVIGNSGSGKSALAERPGAGYRIRMSSFTGHERLYEAFTGEKAHLRRREDATAFASPSFADR